MLDTAALLFGWRFFPRLRLHRSAIAI